MLEQLHYPSRTGAIRDCLRGALPTRLRPIPGKIPAIGGKKGSWYIYLWLIWIILGIIDGGGIYGGAGQVIHESLPFLGSEWWTILLAFRGSAVILTGSYASIERLMTSLVFLFTVITLICAVLLQTTEYAIT